MSKHDKQLNYPHFSHLRLELHPMVIVIFALEDLQNLYSMRFPL